MAYLSAHGLVLANNVSITLVSAICQYIPDFFFLIFSRTFLSLKCSEIRKKFFSGVFCIGKWSRKDTDTSVVSEIIAVKDNVCSVRIFTGYHCLPCCLQSLPGIHRGLWTVPDSRPPCSVQRLLHVPYLPDCRFPFCMLWRR